MESENSHFPELFPGHHVPASWALFYLLILSSLNVMLNNDAELVTTALPFSSIDLSFPTGLIARTLGPSNNFTRLNGWVCLHGVLD